MHRPLSKTVLSMFLVQATWLVAPAWAAKPRSAHVAKVKAALPAQARVKPAKPRKLLVFTLCRGFVHGSIPLAAKTLEMMGSQTGAFEAVVSDDPAVFEPESLKRFDAVCMNNTTGSVFMPANHAKLPQAEQQAARQRDAALKKSFLAFVRGGKGLVGIHAATDCLYEWPDYGEMMGGYFHGHPWGSGDTVGVKLDDPGHPLCAAFRGRGFKIKDEIYQFRNPYSREKLRVLMSIDPDRTDMTKKGLKRTDGDYAVAWVHRYGKGRVFYCSLGHNAGVFYTRDVLQHYLDGIQFALGDLEVDTTPSAKLTQAYLETSRRKFEATLLDDLVKKIAKYEYGQDAGDLNKIAELVVESHADPARRNRIAEQLTAVLETDAAPAAKRFVCKQLWRIGTARVVPPLARMLSKAETADMARYALERMPDAAAGAALREALGKATGPIKVGIVNSLGERHDAQAAEALARLTSDSDPAVAKAAIVALGKIGGRKAAASLSEAKRKVTPKRVPVVDEALLLCAAGMAAQGDAKGAEGIYKTLYKADQLPQTRAAALTGLIAVREEATVPLVLAALNRSDAIVQTAAAGVVRKMTAPGAAQSLAKALPRMKPRAQALLLHALADRGEREVLPSVANAASSGDADVRTAALATLGKLGDASSVLLLAKAAATGKGAEAGTARISLDRLKGSDVDIAMVRALSWVSAAVRVELIRSLGARYAYVALPSLWATATDVDEAVRAESFKSLGVLGSQRDLPKLLELLVNESRDDPRAKAEAAVLALAKRIPNPDERAAAALAIFPATEGNVPARCALVRVFGQLQGDKTLAPIRTGLTSPDPTLKEAAIRALAAWNSPAPLPDLYAVAKEGPTGALGRVALGGYLRLLAMPSDRAAAETAAMYERGLALATRAEEKKTAIAGLADVPDKRAIDIVKRYEKDKALAKDVASALKKLQGRLRQVSASHGSDGAKAAIDGDMSTRWATGTKQEKGQWFQLDMGWASEVRQVVLDAGSSKGDYPRAYEVYVSNSTENWGEPVAKGEGTKPLLKITCKPKAGRYVRIVQTGSTTGLWWSIHELRVETEK